MNKKGLSIQQAVSNFKNLIETSVKTGGSAAKTAMIRSSKPIMNIHDAVKWELIKMGIKEDLIYPHLFESKPELRFAGSLKQKDQDICVVPNDRKPKKEILKEGLLQGVEDEYGKFFTQETLTINVRSQTSSLQKNFDTLYERTISEAQNLHDRCPQMVLGEVYMVAIPEYDDSMFKKKKCVFKENKVGLAEKYIKSFHAISNRKSINKNFYQYEATCLLIVDFSQKSPKIYNSTKELISAGLLPKNTKVKYEGLDWSSFTKRILDAYNHRFGLDKLR